MEKSTKIDRTTLIGFKNQAAKIRFFFNTLIYHVLDFYVSLPFEKTTSLWQRQPFCMRL